MKARSNIVQLPYQEKFEPLECFRRRRRAWHQHKGWIIAPVTPPKTMHERREIAKQQTHIPPLFAHILFDRSA